VLVGEVMETHDLGPGKRDRRRNFALQRVRVLEAFQGIPEGVKEIWVWVDPDFLPGWSWPVEAGQPMLIQAGERKGFAWPAEYRVGAAWVIHGGYCNFSRRLEDAEEDLRYLRARKAGTWQEMVMGVVEQERGAGTSLAVPVKGARVGLAGTGGAVTDAAGRFAFADVAPGEYRVTFAGQATAVTVPAGGCGWWRGVAR